MCITRFLSIPKRKTTKITQEFITYIATNEDLKERTIKDYAGDLKYFTHWLEDTGQQLRIQDLAIPTLTRYRECM